MAVVTNRRARVIMGRMGKLEVLTDAELLAMTARDVEAFAVFYRRHAGWVLGVAARRTRDREQAGDLTAEVFSAALLAAARFRGERPGGEANNWLYGILLHKLAGFERRGAVERRARDRLRLQAPVLSQDEFDRFTEGDDSASRIAAALERLPVDQRDAVRARIVDEQPYPEIAAALQISEANARKRVSRGLGMLRAELEKETDERLHR